MIEALYRASGAGVQVDLIVRGICALRPGIDGLSANIRVRSIVGQFLEHSRVYWFENGGRNQLLLASADWMERNFFRRIEVAFPVQLAKLRARVRADMDGCLADTVNAWELLPDGQYLRIVAPEAAEPFDSQAALLQRYAAAARPPE
jgi:polyphosphate kinase